MGFQVPRVTINIDFKEGTSFGELSIISLGYGLHQAWIYSSMFDKGGIFGTSGLQAGPFNDQLSLAYFVSILVYGLLLLVASVLDTRLIRPLHATPTLVIAALLGSTGTLLLLAPDGSLLSSEALQLASGVLTGAGSSVLLLAWGIAFSRRDSASVVINGALSIAIGFGIYGLVLHQIPFPWGGVASALIPFAEIALLLVLRRHVSLDFDNRQLIFQPLPINHARFVLRFGLPVFFLGVALGIMRQTSIETILPGSAFEDQALLFVTACAATVLIMVTFLALGGDERWHTFFRPLIPFIAVTAVFIPFTAGGASFWGTSVVLVGYMSFEALMWIFFSELSQRFRLSPIFVFGLGRGVMALAALGGSTLPLFTGALGAPTGLGEMGTVLIVLVAMMLAYALLPDEREMASIVAVTPRKVAVQSASRAPLIVVNEGKADALERAREGAVRLCPRAGRRAHPGALQTGSTPSWPPLPSWAKPPARHRGRSPPHLLSFPPQMARPPWTPCRTMHRMQAPLLTPQALPPMPPPPPVRPWTSRAPSSPRRPSPPRPPTTRPPPGAASASAARSSPTPTCCRAAKARSCTTWPAATSPPTSSSSSTSPKARQRPTSATSTAS